MEGGEMTGREGMGEGMMITMVRYVGSQPQIQIWGPAPQIQIWGPPP